MIKRINFIFFLPLLLLLNRDWNVGMKKQWQQQQLFEYNNHKNICVSKMKIQKKISIFIINSLETSQKKKNDR
jgi:hypothetical protein